MQFIHPSKLPDAKRCRLAFFISFMYNLTIKSKESPMHFQKVLNVFQTMVESLEKEMVLQNELISKLEEQNAALKEYCIFLQKELESLKQQGKICDGGRTGKSHGNEPETHCTGKQGFHEFLHPLIHAEARA